MEDQSVETQIVDYSGCVNHAYSEMTYYVSTGMLNFSVWIVEDTHQCHNILPVIGKSQSYIKIANLLFSNPVAQIQMPNPNLKTQNPNQIPNPNILHKYINMNYDLCNREGN